MTTPFKLSNLKSKRDKKKRTKHAKWLGDVEAKKEIRQSPRIGTFFSRGRARKKLKKYYTEGAGTTSPLRGIYK